MTKDDSIDAMKYCVLQKQIDEMYEYTKDYRRSQFVKELVEQRNEIAKLIKFLGEIQSYLSHLRKAKTTYSQKEIANCIERMIIEFKTKN